MFRVDVTSLPLAVMKPFADTVARLGPVVRQGKTGQAGYQVVEDIEGLGVARFQGLFGGGGEEPAHVGDFRGEAGGLGRFRQHFPHVASEGPGVEAELEGVPVAVGVADLFLGTAARMLRRADTRVRPYRHRGDREGIGGSGPWPLWMLSRRASTSLMRAWRSSGGFCLHDGLRLRRPACPEPNEGPGRLYVKGWLMGP